MPSHDRLCLYFCCNSHDYPVITVIIFLNIKNNESSLRIKRMHSIPTKCSQSNGIFSMSYHYPLQRRKMKLHLKYAQVFTINDT